MKNILSVPHGARRKSNFRSHATGWVGFLRLCKDSGIWVFMPSAKNMAQKMYRCTSCVIFTGTASVVRALNGRECGAMAALRLHRVSPLFSWVLQKVERRQACQNVDCRSKISQSVEMTQSKCMHVVLNQLSDAGTGCVRVLWAKSLGFLS